MSKSCFWQYVCSPFFYIKLFFFQSDLIHRIQEDKALNEIPAYKSLMENFTNLELVIMNLQQYSKRGFCLRSNEKNVIKWFISWIYSVLFIHKKRAKLIPTSLSVKNVFQIDQRVVEAFETELRKSAGATVVFAENSEEGRKRWDDLKNRVVEHNIRIMAKYYNRITLAR